MKKEKMTRKQSRLLARSADYKINMFTKWFSIIIALFFAVLFFNGGRKEVINDTLQAIYFVISGSYFAASLIAYLFCLRIKKYEYDGLYKKTRLLSLIYLIFILVGNVFAVLTMLIMLNKKSSLEYKLSYYSSMITTMLLIISILNLFKETTTSIQELGVILLAAVFTLQWICVYFVGKYSTSTNINSNLKFIGYLNLFFIVSGNILAPLIGVIILVKIKNQKKSRDIMWISILQRLFRNPTASAGVIFIVFLLAISLYSSLIFDYATAVQNDYYHILEEPSLAYPFGTDEFGRDVFVRIIFGARISLIVGIVSTINPIIIGGLLGAIAGYYGRRTDNIIMRILDVLYAIPGILLAIAIVASFGASTINLILALSVGGIPSYARMVRAQVLQLADSEFIEASRACGTPSWRIILGDIIPNSLSPVIVRATLSIGGAVLATSALSYLGLGVQPPTPEWGNILKAGSEYLEFYPHLAIFPGFAIVSVVLAFNFFGDGLRDALDPKLK